MTNGMPEGAMEQILSAGLRPRATVWARLVQLWSAVGPGNLFLGTATRIVAAAGVSIGTVLLAGTTVGSLAQLFALAPLLLLSLLGFVEGAERLGPMAELRRSLRYSGRQLAAFRILVFGIAGLGFALAASAFLGAPGAPLARTAMVASLAVSVAAVLTIELQQRIAGAWPAVALPVIWTIFWLGPAMLAGDAWEKLLAGLPEIVGWAVALASAVVAARQVRVLLLGRALTIRRLTHAAG